VWPKKYGISTIREGERYVCRCEDRLVTGGEEEEIHNETDGLSTAWEGA
jgi:hypothetical protein